MCKSLPDLPIPDRFDVIAYRHGDREAICSPDSSLTYGAAREIARRVAHALLESGVVAGDRVVLLFGHGSEGIASLLGVAKSGAIAVPLAASVPPDRRQQIVKDADPRCLVTDAVHYRDALMLAEGRMPVLLVDRLPAAPERDWPQLGIAEPAFILYTSGSSGDAKGVVLTHRSMLQMVEATHDALRITPADRVIMISTFSVGQGFAAMFATLLYGATLCPFDVRRLGFGRLVQWLIDQGISIYFSSATLFRSLVRTLGDVRCPDLRVVRLSSERITTEDVEAFRRLFSRHVELWIAYSTTETSTIAMHRVGADERFPGGVVPVGTAIPGVHVAIEDETGRDLPDGVEGEIVVRGAALPLGYWRDPDRTVRAYSSAADAPHERRCKTGDLGRIRPDGLLEHLGRKDRRVKVRGFRVELEEIETVLARHPSVARAAVMVYADQQSDMTLVAYLELERPGADSMEDIRRFATEHLPDVVVPTAFVALDALPVSDAGKVMLSSLPPLCRNRPALGGAFEAPRTDMERLVAGIWKEVLGLDAIGVQDPLLMVGGDSLRAGQIGSRVSAATGIEVLLWEVLDLSTIGRLAEHVAAKQAAVRRGDL